MDDLLAFSKEVRLQHAAGLPSFVGGQSMGALAALHAVLRDQAAWDGVILGTATIDVEWNWLLRRERAACFAPACAVQKAFCTSLPCIIRTHQRRAIAQRCGAMKQPGDTA